MAQQLPNGKQQFVDINGKPLVGGFVFHYLPSTSTPKDTYQDAALTVLNTNPVVLDARGQASIYGSGNYRQVLQDATLVQIWDQVILDAAGQLSGDLANTSDPTKGVSLIPTAERMVPNISTLKTLPKTGGSVYAFVEGFYAPGDGGGGHYYLVVGDTSSPEIPGLLVVAADGGRWQLIYTDSVSLKQFGAKGNFDGTTGADDTAAIQTAADSGIRKVSVPSVAAGLAYQTTGPINITKPVLFIGQGFQTQIALGALQNSRGPGSWYVFNHLCIGFNVKRRTPGFQGVELEKIGTARIHTVTGGTFTPTACDFDVVADDCADLKLIDFCMWNANKGLLVTNGQQGRVWVERLYGQPLSVGIRVLLSFDSVRLNNIHFWPYWSNNASVYAYQKLNTIGLNTWRADGLFINNYFSIYHRIGWQVSGDVTNGTTFKAEVSNMFLDNCAFGYFVDSSARGHTASINTLNIQMDPAVVDTAARPFLVQPDSCDIDIVNFSSSLSIAEAVNIAGPFNRVNIHNPKVYDWAKGVAAAAMICGDVNSVLNISGRKIFDQGGANVVYSGVGKIVAPVDSGHFSGSTSGTGDVVINHVGRVNPNVVKVQVRSTASLIPIVIATTSTNFTVRFFVSNTAAPLLSSAILFDWQAEMA